MAAVVSESPALSNINHVTTQAESTIKASSPMRHLPLRSPIRAAVVGAGKISAQHSSSLGQLEQVHIVGVCDLSQAMAEFTAEQFEVDHHFTDFEKMMQTIDSHVVHISTFHTCAISV